jgi:large subunit ribosomal protein L4
MAQAIISFADPSKKLADQVALNASVFPSEGAGFNKDLVHQAIDFHLSVQRGMISKAQKSRADVAFSKKKPWRQKGTGNARSGTKGSPIWRTGGVTFAAKPRHVAKRMPKKMYRAAMRSIFAEQHRLGRLVLVDDVVFPQVKTKIFSVLMQAHQWEGRVLLVSDVLNQNVMLSSRNLHKITCQTASDLNPYDLFRADWVVVSKKALAHIEEWLDVKS